MRVPIQNLLFQPIKPGSIRTTGVNSDVEKDVTRPECLNTPEICHRLPRIRERIRVLQPGMEVPSLGARAA
jgi:hypothetical protein